MADKKVERNLTPRDFEFVQAEKKLYDKKFETKPIGYFRDAMIRFGKNKTNVVATTILFLIILGTILIPIFSTKNYTNLEAELAFLPPRVPILEKIGFLDGTSRKEGLPVDPASIDPETGLGIPIGYIEETIEMDTLVNYPVECTDRSYLCVGGYNQLSIDPGATFVQITQPNSKAWFLVTEANNPEIVVIIEEFVNENNSVLHLVLSPDYGTTYVSVLEITEAGTYTINPFEAFSDISFPWGFSSNIRFRLESDSRSDKVLITSVQVFDDTQEEPVYEDSGFSLSQYTITAGAGLWVRSQGEITMADFVYKDYVAALGATQRTIPKSLYDAILLEYADVCVVDGPHPDPVTYPDGFVFTEGCPIMEVMYMTEPVVVQGVEYFSYELVLNYARYMGYDEMPYFLFGTDFNGRDLFTLLWVATRTSLLLGLVVASINVSIGVVYGAISGYYGGTVDIILQRITEVIGRIPWLVTLAIFVSFFGPGIQTLILILIVSGWIGPQAVTRTQFYRYKGREYVLASRTLGAKDSRLIFRHILPNGIGTIITASILTIPYTIFAESTISYLGFGVGHGQQFNVFGISFSGVSVGVLLSDGRNYLLDRPYITIFPALLISILMITFNMFGNALRDAFNPSLRGSE